MGWDDETNSSSTEPELAEDLRSASIAYSNDVDNTSDIYEEKAMLIVEQLIEQDTVAMDDSTPVLFHVPSGRRFASCQNLAHFHQGWEAAKRDTEGEGET